MIAINIPMPECCDGCPCNDDGYKCGVTGGWLDCAKQDKERLPDCPLIDLIKYDDDLK